MVELVRPSGRGKVRPVSRTGQCRVTFLCVFLLSGAVPASASVQSTASSQLPALKQLSIEELLEVDVTLPLRRDERVMDAPVAISLLTSEDIRRAGAVTLPETLRAVPGLFAARFGAASWVISSRGFASTSANKMLVMIDGRSVYSPLFSGVFWDQQDASLLDLERIEVIRGPGASLWGSNAVNGVINVVSRRAADTQGTLVTIGGGAEEQFNTSVRYGGSISTGHYRVYGKTFVRDAVNLANGGDAGDGQRFGQGGFRIDLGTVAGDRPGFTLQGDAYRSRVSFADRDDIRGDGANLLARWTRRPSPTTQFQLQTYFDRTHRFVQAQTEEQRNTVDIDAQYRWSVNPRHTLSVGGGYRYSADDTEASPILRFEPEDRATNLLAGFVQDEITVTPRFTAIVGTKIERNDYTGTEWQPSGRIRWMPNSTQAVWAAVSRAVRMPTRFDTDLRILQNGVVIIAGNPDFQSETVVAYEAGYRAALSRTFAFSVNGFYNQYDHIRTQELQGTRVVLGNGLNNDSTGLTATAMIQPRSWITIRSSYTALSHELTLDRDSSDLGRGALETIDPDRFAMVQGRFNLPRGVEVDITTRFIAALPGPRPPTPPTPAYNEADFRIAWRATRGVELALIGRDMLHADHVEFISPTTERYTRIERAIHARVTLAF